MLTFPAILKSIELLEPQESGELQIFGMCWSPEKRMDYLTLDEALARGVLEVSEVSDSGSVPTLKVNNKGDLPVFLMAGEQLSGGKQNRVLNASIFVQAHTEIPIPVSCVERGRWAYRTGNFGGSGSSSHSRLRKLMHKHTSESLRSTGEYASKQGEVWQEVDRKLNETNSRSETMVLQKAYENVETQLASIIAELHPPEGASGVTFVLGGKIIGFDLFDRPSTLAQLWPKLIRAYAIDALPQEGNGPNGRVTVADVSAWLNCDEETKAEVFPSPGEGEDVRIEGRQWTAACLLARQHPIHIEAFARETSPVSARP